MFKIEMMVMSVSEERKHVHPCGMTGAELDKKGIDCNECPQPVENRSRCKASHFVYEPGYEDGAVESILKAVASQCQMTAPRLGGAMTYFIQVLEAVGSAMIRDAAKNVLKENRKEKTLQ